MIIYNTTDSVLQHISTNWTTDNGQFNYNIYENVTEYPKAISLGLQVHRICYHHIGPLICTMGIVCNIINLLVLTRHQLKESPYTYLTAIAITDLSALTLSFLFLVFSIHSSTYFWKFYEAYILFPVANIFTTSSIWIIVVLTIERLLFVRVPLWAKDACNRAGAKVKIMCVICAAAILNIPRFLSFEVDQSNGSNSTYKLGSTPFRSSEFFFIITWFYSILIHFIPLTIVSLVNIYLIYAVHRANQTRKKMQMQTNHEATFQKEQTRLTITLISIITLFIICIIPSAFADRPIAKALFSGNRSEAEFIASDTYLIFQSVSNVLVWCNLSLNFVLYCAFNQRFVKVLRWMVQRWMKALRKKREHSSYLLHVNFKLGQLSTYSNTRTSQTKVSDENSSKRGNKYTCNQNGKHHNGRQKNTIPLHYCKINLSHSSSSRSEADNIEVIGDSKI